jgi:hypothetical protein
MLLVLNIEYIVLTTILTYNKFVQMYSILYTLICQYLLSKSVPSLLVSA